MADGLRVVNNNRTAAVSPSGYNPYYEQTDSLLADLEEEEAIHKTILVGDSGVGKTSLLVQFDQGKFQGGSFSATVGIGFTTVLPITMSFVTQSTNGSTSIKRKMSIKGGGRKPNGHAYRHQLTSPEPFDVSYKVMLIGDSGAGKTCLLVKFKDGTFLAGNFISTVGIDYRNKVVNVDGARVKLQIWDTAGQERFRSVTHAYYRDAHALLLLYDVSNKSSFDNTRAWLGEINEYAQEDVVIMLLGNKADMNQDRVIKCEDGERLAKEYNVAFMETSAKTGLNVELAFMAVARQLRSHSSPNANDPKFNVNEYVRTQSQRQGCCS